ncbi:MAG: N utilization substance protein B [Caulobacter sp. 12-67-6]|nr:MAG: N utilization substance protein B [Caulobacter sp. 12-67-6]OYX72981.1 MAG: N utilization substance protein B [Caulobacter sp. 32-67-35]OYX96870.1 MAG: N utilization substance protein B [Caulobacter sp. 35-67-4]OZA73671.1 MAG: N utilization substance protein B [Caulobacter sp. 39-67-4]HQR90453.1 transcription antitermination factor NusB [Caulobacter sp.]
MSKNNRIQPRSVARLAAVQALYQMEVSGVGVDAVVREFSEHRFDRDVDGPDGDQLAAADETFFAELAKGVVDKQGEVDQAIVKRLASGWRLDRLDATARAVLRAGAFELMHRPDVPTEVVIDEYVEIAKSFFEGPEAGFINGALDAIARDART